MTKKENKKYNSALCVEQRAKELVSKGDQFIQNFNARKRALLDVSEKATATAYTR